MAFDHSAAMRIGGDLVTSTYRQRDTILYGLGLGAGADPIDRDALRFVYEGGAGLRALPTMAVTLVPSTTRALGLDMARVLHGEQRLTIHTPLRAEDSIISETRTLSIIDKGAGRGAIVNIETTARRAEDGAALFTSIKTLFARGDGGCGAPAAAALPVHTIPDRGPDGEHAITTHPDQALLYRLSGDHNPLHADPEAARAAGFDRPILHGLCTYGIAGRAILAALCDNDPQRIRALDVRFTAPVFPGETIVTRLWCDGDIVSFRCHVPARDVVVIDNGRCVIGTAS